MQDLLAGQEEKLVALQQDKDASDSDWEQRLKEAVDSAEQWKAFAEKLGSEKDSLSAQIGDLETQLQVVSLLPAFKFMSREQCWDNDL